jgi:NADPH:quinone reductase-like Zn-dependent oxidoreductase
MPGPTPSLTGPIPGPIPVSMRAVLLCGHGGFDQLEFRDDVAVPVPSGGEVLLRVGAAAVNNTDVNTRVGWYSGGGWTGSFAFPRIQGIDCCGEIVGVGDGVDSDRIGERVLVEPTWTDEEGATVFLGSEVDGAFAEYVVVPSRAAHTVRSSFTDVELASFPCSWSTAENLLTRSGLARGERVLVTGASGGVGSAAVQLASVRGAQVTAVAASAKHAELLSCGASVVIDRSESVLDRFGHDSFDVVVDVVGGDSWPHLLDVLRPRGRYAVSGAIAGPLVSLDLRTLYLKDLTLIGCTVLDDGVFASLVRRIERGEVRPMVAAEFPLERIVEAQQWFLTKAHVGKIVLTLR